MLDILKILVVFAGILILLRLKWNIGYVLLIASAILSVLYLMPISVILSTIESTLTDTVTIKLFFALTLIRMLELVLREKDVLARMMEASRILLRNKKAVIISMPMLIGMLPSLGGAYFSAPMVAESTKGLKMSQDEKGFINYWFRHPWEYVLPLYPGILLASAISKIDLRSIMLANMTYAVIVFFTGFLFSMRNIQRSDASAGGQKSEKKQETKGWQLLWSFMPVGSILILVIALHVELHYALGIVILLLFVFYRFSAKDLLRSFRYGFTRDVIILIFGSMLFKFTMENSGAVMHLSSYFSEKGIPLLPVLFALPFISGILTGLTVGFVGGTFPLLISLAGGANLNEISFAFASGFVGVLLSPVHLCLVLTREYFRADMWSIYKRTIPGCVLIMAGAITMYFVL